MDPTIYHDTLEIKFIEDHLASIYRNSWEYVTLSQLLDLVSSNNKE